jgi:hypothetical protein
MSVCVRADAYALSANMETPYRAARGSIRPISDRARTRSVRKTRRCISAMIVQKTRSYAEHS